MTEYALEEHIWPSTVGSSIACELGKADQDHPHPLRLAEAFCSPEASDVEEIDPRDWMLAVFASDGEICLRVKEVPEVAYVGYEDGTLVVSVHNDVFLRRMTIEPEAEDVQELIERYTPQLTLRRRTPFASDEDGDPDA
jgi:hypothetical protein